MQRHRFDLTAHVMAVKHEALLELDAHALRNTHSEYATGAFMA